MENKINIAELLKDCPEGMELDCTMYDNCTYAGIEDVGYIDILINTPSGRIRLTKEGCYIRHDDNAKCVIFPKGKTTWEGFQRPFKDGDIISNGDYVAIFHKIGTPCNCTSPNVVYYHCYYSPKFRCFKKEVDFGIGISTEFKYATEEEKQKLFDAIKANGYKWNPETKTLEKLPKFKIGDKIKLKNSPSNLISTVTKINDDGSICVNDYTWVIKYELQDKYELIPNKFDINTLKPFDKVLVRDHNAQEWVASLFSNYNEPKKYKYICVNGSGYAQCIPYEGNEHLLGTTDDCDDYHKTWE